MSNPIMHHLVVGDDTFEIYDAAARAGIGSPLMAATVADMTDNTKIYVYTGSESGYTFGNWYYFNGTAWVSGGVYNSAAINVDDTLSVEGAAADAKAAGDGIRAIDAELDQKANIDGVYEGMTVGNAEQLISSVTSIDKDPYNFRTSGGSADIGNRMIDNIVGGTVAWNQLVQNGNFSDDSVWSWQSVSGHSVSNNVATVTFKTNLYNHYINQVYMVNAGHVYLARATVQSTDKPNGLRFMFGNYTFWFNGSIATKTVASAIGKVTDDYIYNNFIIRFQDGNTGGTATIEKVNLIDLTAMFGSTIADYIYSLEQTTEGAGVAWFRHYFPKAYYAYNAGELMSVQTSGHKTVGFNAFNSVTGTAKLVGGNEYQITGTYSSVSYTDINGDSETLSIDEDGLFTPSSDGILTVGGSADDTCVHLTWSGYRNDDFEEYVEYIYPLDDSLELRGTPKLVDGKLEYDGDIYESDGIVTRKYGIVDLGSLNYSYDDTVPRFVTSDLSNSIARPTSEITPSNGICSKILRLDSFSKIYSEQDNVIGVSSVGNMSIKCSAYHTVEAFKTAMSGVYLVYELATPTEEQADPFQNPQTVDDFGTEEYVDTRDIPIPVGHVTEYMANLRDKVQHLPDLASTDGVYHIQQSGQQMALVADISNARCSALEAKLPDAPSADGTYHLSVTVADGTPTYSWVSE